MKSYNKGTKDEIIRLHIREVRTIDSLTQEYHFGIGTLQYWFRELRKKMPMQPLNRSSQTIT